MPFLKNAWYMAAWSEEVGRTQIARTILGIPMLLFRRQDGTPVAMGDICPHRFAPLHKGHLVGDEIQCPYHGIRFSAGGKCTHVPDGPAPDTLSVATYSVAERDSLLWVWPGDAPPDMASLPKHEEMNDREGVAVQRGGYLQVKSDYRLVADNLLDLSHAEFLHPFLGNPGSVSRTTFEVREEEGVLIAHTHLRNEPMTGFLRVLWEDTQPDVVDMMIDIYWRAPADMRLDVSAVAKDGRSNGKFKASGPHIVTPETETTCHYFFGNSRNMKIDNAMINESGVKMIGVVFEAEDVPMIEAQERYRAFAANLGMRMRTLKQDEAIMRANRTLDQMIASERR